MNLDISSVVYFIWAVSAVFSAALAFAFYRRTYPPISAKRRTVLAALRTGAFFLLFLLIFDPVLISKRQAKIKPRVVILLDRSRSMSVSDEKGLSRFDAALQDALWMEKTATALGAETSIFAFSRGLSYETLHKDSAIAPDGDGTDINGSLASLRDRFRGEDIEALILLSDGRITRGMASSKEAPFARVFAVGYGDTAMETNVAIEDVEADRISYTGTDFSIEAVIRARGCKGKGLQLRLLEEGRVVSNFRAAILREEEILNARFFHTFDSPGMRHLTVLALSDCAERDSTDNRASFEVDVRKGQLRILYIDQFPDWNTAFLGELTGSSPRLVADIVVWLAGSGFVHEDTKLPFAFPLSSYEISSYDLVAVSEDGGMFTDRRNVEILSRYLEDGGSVLFLADEGSPLARSASARLLEKILPIKVSSMPRLNYEEVSIEVASEALFDPFVSDNDLSSFLRNMPPLSASISGVEITAGARILLVSRGKSHFSPFLAIERKGEGVAAVVLAFPLWKWKLFGIEGERTYESFLGGLFQYLAEGAESASITLDADRSFYRSGDRVLLTASIGERSAPDVIRGVIRKVEGKTESVISTVLFQPDFRKRGFYRASLDALEAGDYKVTAEEIRDGRITAFRSISISVEPSSVEFMDVSMDRKFLEKIATASGGEFLDRSQARSIFEKVDLSPRVHDRATAYSLRNFFAVFVAIAALLGVEWAFRKIWGLV